MTKLYLSNNATVESNRTSS